jgi:hypothetical protein
LRPWDRIGCIVQLKLLIILAVKELGLFVVDCLGTVDNHLILAVAVLGPVPAHGPTLLASMSCCVR